MPEPDTATDRVAEEIRAVLERVTHRGYDAPQGDWIQNPRPLPALPSPN